jgi:Arf-GAP/Rho-GAP domain/ANK repeat/PH domain-containing protein 3
MGWALKNSSSSRRFTKAQKKYLTDLFVLGEQTGRKADPEQVSKAMRKTRDANGSFLFDANSYLTSKQIASFFSRLSAKKSLPATCSSTADDEEEESIDDLLASQEEIEFERVRQELLSEFVIAHPIFFDTYNICQMVAVSSLSKLSISVLQDICKYFELDCSDIMKKRRQPYVDILTEFVKSSCTCID